MNIVYNEASDDNILRYYGGGGLYIDLLVNEWYIILGDESIKIMLIDDGHTYTVDSTVFTNLEVVSL
jgi:hypothetical protein